VSLSARPKASLSAGAKASLSAGAKKASQKAQPKVFVRVQRMGSKLARPKRTLRERR
jgi:hypothetical protein